MEEGNVRSQKWPGQLRGRSADGDMSCRVSMVMNKGGRIGDGNGTAKAIGGRRYIVSSPSGVEEQRSTRWRNDDAAVGEEGSGMSSKGWGQL